MLDKIKNSKITMRLFSVIIAVVIWLVITYSLNPVISQQIKFIPVTFTGEGVLASNGLVVLDKENTDTVSVKVRGPRNSVIKAMSTITAKVDLSDITDVGEWTGDVSFDIGISGVSIDGRNTAKVQLMIDELSEKEVPVVVSKIGNEKDKNKILSCVPEIDTAKVTGAKSELSDVKAIAIDIDASDIKEETTEEYSYYFINNQGLKQKFTSIKTSFDTISVKTSLMDKKTVSLDIVLSKNDHMYYLQKEWVTSEKIEVGVSEAFEGDRIEVPFNPDIYTEEAFEYRLTIEAPEGVYVPYESREIVVKLDLKELEKETVTLLVEGRNIENGLSYSIVKPEISASVQKVKDTSLTDKVKAYVDLDGLGEGHHNVELKLESDEPVFLVGKPTVGVLIYNQKG